MSHFAGGLLGGVRALAAGVAELVLPEACCACEDPRVAANRLCERCNVALLGLVSLAYCPRCGATLGPNIPARDDGCWACPNPLPRFSRVVRLGPYTGPLRSIIHELKYRRRDAMRRRLGALLAQAVRGGGTHQEFDVVLPVPMHWRRRLARGYDHARVLARAVARELRLPLGDELVRVRNTPPQTHLSRTRRIENVRRAFALRPRENLAGASVLLVDDVTTTGATASEAARTILAGKALHVTLAVVAKSESPRAYTQRQE